MTRNRGQKAAVRAQMAATGAPYMEARRQLTSPTLGDVMREHPLLNSFGIGVFDSRRKSPSERRAELAAERAVLAAHETTVVDVAAWLRENIAPIKTPSVGSYTMKHVVERAIGRYVTNGELIAAALLAGYSFKYTDGPNVLFGMSVRDVKRTER
ncbi:hypothetical protein [Modestobacter sp. SYSU DS0657]